MKRLLMVFAIFALPGTSSAVAAAQEPAGAASSSARQRGERAVGEVTAADAETGRLTIRTDAGAAITTTPDERTTFRRVAAGATTLENAEQITRRDVTVGDRVIVAWRAGEGSATAAPSQIVVTSRAALEERTAREREGARRRSLGGRVTAVDAAKKEFTVAARGRDGAEAITVVPGPNARFLRYAPDSMRAADAVPSALAELKVGDQVRARGERSADGARFTAEEVTAGQFVRLGGAVSSVNAARGEVTIKLLEGGKLVTVALGKNSTLRRVPAEVAEEVGRRREEREGMTEAERRAEREARRENRAAARRQQQQAGGAGERRGGEGAGGRRGPGAGGGGNIMQMAENFPAVAPSELKKGDAVLVTATPSAADESRVTAIMLLTGDAEFLGRLLRTQGRGGERRETETGLPGSVLGGGNNPQRDPP
jgi:Cu/Ag efflux protein CusF